MQKGLIIHTAIYNDQGEFLVIRRAAHRSVYPNLWDIPGGTLEDGEDPMVGAKREISEETSLVVEDLSLFSHTSNIDEEKDKQFVRLLFIAQYPGGEIQVSPAEHQDYRWIKPNEINSIETVYYLPDMFKLLSSKSHQLLEY